MVCHSFRFLGKRQGLSGFMPALLALLFAAVADEAVSQSAPDAGQSATDHVIPNPSQGSVGSSGKFVPAQHNGKSPETPMAPDEWESAAARLIEKTGDHTLRIGIVQCDRSERTLTIPAQVNAREGLVEYALVTRKGKIHESLLSTDADPLHVQMAAMLLGMSPQPGKQPACEVTVEVEWATNGPAKKVALEDLIALAGDSTGNANGGRMARGPWKFTGSQIDSSGFVAAREGSIIALIDDPASLVANPRHDRQDDTLHSPQTAAMPGIGIPVSVRIRCKAAHADEAGMPLSTGSSSPKSP